MTCWRRVGAFLFVASFFVEAALILTGAFFLTTLIFHLVDAQPNPFIAQLIGALLGLILCAAIFGGVGFLLRSKQWALQMNVFGPIFEAMQTIAKGDFSVRLDDRYRDNALVSELRKNVNNMALELSQIEALRQEFISNVSHELQSPLTSIRGFAQALRHEQVSAQDTSHYLAIIEDESARLSKLTDNLLRLTSLEAAQVAFEPRPYALDRQIRNVVLAAEPQWLGKAIEMELVLQDVTITADANLLSQVWTNLLHNSVKCTPEGGRITIELHQDGATVVFSISDTGVGIAEESKARIFERFYTADPSRTHTTTSGSGLGLSIAQKIVEMHRGAITAESALGVGAIFTVTLPAVAAARE